MKTKDQIKFLNSLIAQLKAASSVSMVGCRDAERKARTMQGEIIKELESKGFDKGLVEAINCIDFSGLHQEESEPKHHFLSSISEIISSRGGCTSKGEQAYYHSMQKMVDILTDYRDLLKDKMDMPMKMWTLIFSAVAAVGTIATLLFTIF